MCCNTSLVLQHSFFRDMDFAIFPSFSLFSWNWSALRRDNLANFSRSALFSGEGPAEKGRQTEELLFSSGTDGGASFRKTGFLPGKRIYFIFSVCKTRGN